MNPVEPRPHDNERYNTEGDDVEIDRRHAEILDQLASYEKAVRVHDRKQTPIYREGPRWRIGVIGFILLWVSTVLGFTLLASSHTAQCDLSNERWKKLADSLEVVAKATPDPEAARQALAPIVRAAQPTECPSLFDLTP